MPLDLASEGAWWRLERLSLFADGEAGSERFCHLAEEGEERMPGQPEWVRRRISRFPSLGPMKSTDVPAVAGTARILSYPLDATGDHGFGLPDHWPEVFYADNTPVVPMRKRGRCIR
jgi:hypothetical protein